MGDRGVPLPILYRGHTTPPSTSSTTHINYLLTAKDLLQLVLMSKNMRAKKEDVMDSRRLKASIFFMGRFVGGFTLCGLLCMQLVTAELWRDMFVLFQALLWGFCMIWEKDGIVCLVGTI